MSNETPPPVLHSIRCICRACCDARRDEARARKEELAGRYAAFFEAPPLKKAPPPSPGSLRAIAKRFGRGAR